MVKVKLGLILKVHHTYIRIIDANPQDEIPFWTHKQIEIYPKKPRIKSKESRPVEILFQEPRFGENATKGLPLISF